VLHHVLKLQRSPPQVRFQPLRLLQSFTVSWACLREIFSVLKRRVALYASICYAPFNIFGILRFNFVSLKDFILIGTALRRISATIAHAGEKQKSRRRSRQWLVHASLIIFVKGFSTNHFGNFSLEKARAYSITLMYFET
ncbi:hypothetical protein, partial [Leptospira stimsonii]|uniref:hypothetical protein n=1 Tax=Leptospira stimsonii TaxID=2202203 RepID=UPI0019D5F554